MRIEAPKTLDELLNVRANILDLMSNRYCDIFMFLSLSDKLDKIDAEIKSLSNATQHKPAQLLESVSPTISDSLLPSVYHCKSCGCVSTRRNEYTYINGVLFCVRCKQDYEAGVENVTRWVDSALNAS